MGSKPDPTPLGLFFLPMMAPGHAIPMVDIAKLLATRGVHCTVITTPAFAPLLRPAIDRSDRFIRVLLLPFPSVEAGLPDGCEDVKSIPKDSRANFVKAINLLRKPFEQLLREHLPDAVITDMFFPWTADISRELGIPRLVFHGTSFFSLCAMDCVHRLALAGEFPDGEETFLLPGLPHPVKIYRTQLPRGLVPEFVELLKSIPASEAASYGVVVNSFYELEPDYAEHYRNVVGRRAWHVGPVSLSLYSKNMDATALRGGETSADCTGCLRWLGTQTPRSVLYVCFGSLVYFRSSQLMEIAAALEASNHPFVWVIGRTGAGEGDADSPLEGFVNRMERSNRGVVLRGWAPQLTILNHEAVGGFMTHCGWNSSLESITAGLPMVTWPLFAEQFYNEILLVDVLEIAVGVGTKQYNHYVQEDDRAYVKAEAITAAVEAVMGAGEAAESMRRRARAMGEAAKRAVDEGGSSDADISRLIHELGEARKSH